MYWPISKKINYIILIALILGVGSITLILFNSLYQTINNDTKRNIEQQSEILHTSIKNFMLPGQAPLAVNLLEDLATSNPNFTIKLYRSDGTDAFSDNKTINIVNKNLGKEAFIKKENTGGYNDSYNNDYNNDSYDYGSPTKDLPTTTEFINLKDGDKTFIKIYKPLKNSGDCATCHGSDHDIRGVIEITGDITESETQKKSGIIQSLIIFPIIVILLLIIITTFIHRSVINPVKKIGEICTLVTDGVFTEKVEINNNDEIGDLGNTVNSMTKGLKERFELSKYVSQSTLESLAIDQKEGVNSDLTLFFSDIRGFTSYSEKHTPKEVVSSLNKILTFQSQIIKSEGGDIDKFVGDEIMAIFSGEDQEQRACRAAIKIQEELLKHSEKDYESLMVGIGINRGEVILGMLGSNDRADFTVIGDNVNTAARLCSAAGKSEIIVKDNIYKVLKDKKSFGEPITISVKGKDKGLIVYKYKG